MRPIDADFAKERIKKSDLTSREKIAFLLILEDVPILAPPPNDPLTLEELREMDGEPVWVTPGGFWALVIANPGERVRLICNERDAVCLALYHAGYTVRQRRRKDGNKTVIYIEYRKGES